MNDAEREALERRIDELCAEVEKYKSARDASVDLATKTIDRIRELEAEVEYARQTSRSRLERIDQLKAENANLRELVKDMWPHVRHRSRMCAKCDLPCDTSDECLLYEPMRQRMRELGLVVE